MVSICFVNGGGWSPAGDAPFAWLVNYDYNYFIKDGIDIGDQPDGLEMMF